MKYLLGFMTGVTVVLAAGSYSRWLPGLLSRGDSVTLETQPRERRWVNGEEVT